MADTQSRLIVAQRLSDCASDAGQLEPDLQSIPAGLGQPTAALELYVGVHREDARAQRRYDYHPPQKLSPPKQVTDPVLLAMAAKLKTPASKTMYRQRASTVEPVFGILKSVLGFRQFRLRGLEKVSLEWTLVCLSYNFRRRHRLGLGEELAAAG